MACEFPDRTAFAGTGLAVKYTPPATHANNRIVLRARDSVTDISTSPIGEDGTWSIDFAKLDVGSYRWLILGESNGRTETLAVGGVEIVATDPPTRLQQYKNAQKMLLERIASGDSVITRSEINGEGVYRMDMLRLKQAESAYAEVIRSEERARNGEIDIDFTRIDLTR